MKSKKSVQMSHEDFMEVYRKDRLRTALLAGGLTGVAWGGAALLVVASVIGLWHGEFLSLVKETFTTGIPLWIWSPYLAVGLVVGLLKGYAEYQREEDERQLR